MLCLSQWKECSGKERRVNTKQEERVIIIINNDDHSSKITAVNDEECVCGFPVLYVQIDISPMKIRV